MSAENYQTIPLQTTTGGLLKKSLSKKNLTDTQTILLRKLSHSRS